MNGARGLRIEPASDGTNQSPNVIGGTASNFVNPGVHSATIGGGGRGDPSDPASGNAVTDDGGTVGGGADNQAGDSAGTTTDAALATVGGGGNNTGSGGVSTVGGGFSNTASGHETTVGGGYSNSATGRSATVGGGSLNTASAEVTTIGGGSENTASALWATVAGGNGNAARGRYANVGGGFGNTAVGEFATVAGGANNRAAGEHSLAAGSGALAVHDGAFVWADETSAFFSSGAQNQFSVRSTGGARFVSQVDASGTPTAGVTLAPGGGSWSSLSDEASKRAIEPVSGRSVLRELASVPISTWSYRAQDDSIRHIGPMAQDFYRAFGVGESRRRISSVDADGVALAAIQGLSEKLRVERRRRHEQEQRLDRLEARLTALERGE